MTAGSARLAFVTGASAGIGAAYAQRFAHDGYDIVAVGRRVDRLEALAQRWRTSYGRAVTVEVADLSRDEDLHRLEAIVQADDRLAVLVNNAGFTPLVPFTETSHDDIEAMIRVHVLALTRLTRAALPGMMARGHGDIINVSSDGAFVPEPSSLMTVYAATKAYVNTFTRAIDAQARSSGIRSQAACAGYVRTEILERYGISFADWGIPAAATMEPEEFVDASLAALELGEVIAVPTLDDTGLLERIDELRLTVRERSSSSGTPAPRYEAVRRR